MEPVSAGDKLLNIILLTLALHAGAVSVSAQTGEDTEDPTVTPIVTDRPTDSASPTLIPQRTFQVEAGYKFSRQETDSDRIDTHILPDLLMRYGINKQVEVRMSGTNWTFQDDASGNEDGLSDFSVGTKIALADERGNRPQMSLLVDVSLPVGHSEFTNGYVIPKILFLGANSLTDRIALTYNLGPSVVTSEPNGDKQTNFDLNYAVSLSGAAGGSVSIFGELYGAFASGSNGLDRHNFQAGATILLSRRFQIDFRGGLGLVENEPDWLVGAGLAFRLPH